MCQIDSTEVSTSRSSTLPVGASIDWLALALAAAAMAAVLRFKNGALGTIEASTAAYPGLLKKTEIHGTEGSVIVEQDDILNTIDGLMAHLLKEIRGEELKLPLPMLVE